MKVKVKRWHGVAVWKWEIIDEDVSSSASSHLIISTCASLSEGLVPLDLRHEIIGSMKLVSSQPMHVFHFKH